MSAWEMARSLLFTLRPLPVASLAVGVMIALGTSLSVAASSALPGDLLYPVKVLLNENVLAVLNTSTQSRAQFEAKRLEIRLEEAGQLAASGRLHGDVQADVSTTIEEQLLRIQQAASELAASGNTAAALDVHSQVESNLMANAAVLGALVEASPAEDETVKEDVQDLLKNVSKAERVAVESRVATEAKVSAGAAADVKAVTEASIRAATEKIEETRALMEKMNGTVYAEVRSQTNARFAHSKKLLASAREKLDAGQSVDAFHVAKEAQRTAQAVIAMLKVSVNLQLRLNAVSPPLSEPDPTTSSASSVSVSSVQSSVGASAEARVDAAIDAATKAVNDAKADIQGKIDGHPSLGN